MADAPDSSTERSSHKAAWGNRLVSAALGILVTVIGALIIGTFQAREPALVYSSTESLPFNGLNGEVSIYQVTISNDGKREANDVACIIRIPTGKVDQYKVTASPLLSVSGSTSGDSVTVQVPNLNPSESFQVSLLVSGTQSLPSRPQISARGRGILGTEKNPEQNKSESDPVLWVSLAAFSAVFISGVFTLIFRRTKTFVPSSTGSGDDQRQVLAYICRANGLSDLADQYSSQPHETTYWAEADRLGQIATDTQNGERMAAIERSLLALVEYDTNLADTSKAIVFYNVALINRCKKDEPNYKKYLELAKETSRNQIERRLKVDPRFG